MPANNNNPTILHRQKAKPNKNNIMVQMYKRIDRK